MFEQTGWFALQALWTESCFDWRCQGLTDNKQATPVGLQGTRAEGLPDNFIVVTLQLGGVVNLNGLSIECVAVTWHGPSVVT